MANLKPMTAEHPYKTAVKQSCRHFYLIMLMLITLSAIGFVIFSKMAFH